MEPWFYGWSKPEGRCQEVPTGKYRLLKDSCEHLNALWLEVRHQSAAHKVSNHFHLFPLLWALGKQLWWMLTCPLISVSSFALVHWVLWTQTSLTFKANDLRVHPSGESLKCWGAIDRHMVPGICCSGEAEFMVRVSQSFLPALMWILSRSPNV